MIKPWYHANHNIMEAVTSMSDAMPFLTSASKMVFPNICLNFKSFFGFIRSNSVDENNFQAENNQYLRFDLWKDF